MKRSKTFLFAAMFVMIVIITILIAFIYLLATSKREISLAVLAAILSVFSLLYTQNTISKREIVSRHFIKKAEVYSDIVEALQDIMGADKGFTRYNPDDLTKRIFHLQTKLLIWGGADVISAWVKMSSPSIDGERALICGKQLLSAIRAELGHDDKTLEPLGMLAVIVKSEDHEELIKTLTRSA